MFAYEVQQYEWFTDFFFHTFIIDGPCIWSKMLKQRAKSFLERYTPQVLTAISAFVVCEHDTRARMSDNIASKSQWGNNARQKC